MWDVGDQDQLIGMEKCMNPTPELALEENFLFVVNGLIQDAYHY